MQRIVIALAVLGLAAGTWACGASNTAKGAGIGAVGGAVVGGVVGHETGNTAVGAIMGAAIGGAAGAVIGDYMDDQVREMERDLEGADIERVGEGIKITFDSGLFFAFDSAALSSRAASELTDLAVILRKYDDTNILIEGHTDSRGSEQYNLELSDRRADSVFAHLLAQGVSAPRMTTIGYGESQPIADNDTAEGRARNRRVEVAIFANEDLKKAAERKTAGS